MNALKRTPAGPVVSSPPPLPADRNEVVARRVPWRRQIVQCLLVAALAAAFYIGFSRFILQSVTVVGLSMAPTLGDSQRYLLNRWVYHVHPPRRNDVVVLSDPLDNGFSVKRVIAVAGDSVRLVGGTVYLNGKKLEEGYLPLGTSTYPSAGAHELEWKCGQDEFFVLGDNRGNSVDSRTYGVVRRQRILGMVMR